MNKGILLVISGPSGTGKGTVLKTVFQHKNDIVLSISATTRPKRENEIDGKDYFFMSKSDFEELIKKNQVLEYAEYCGNYYGTPQKAVEEWINAGKTVILEVETQGAFQIKEKFPEAVLIFLLPPSFNDMKNRLVNATTGTRTDIERRVETAVLEIGNAHKYDYVVINEDVSAAAMCVSSIIDASFHASHRMGNYINEVLKKC